MYHGDGERRRRGGATAAQSGNGESDHRDESGGCDGVQWGVYDQRAATAAKRSDGDTGQRRRGRVAAKEADSDGAQRRRRGTATATQSEDGRGRRSGWDRARWWRRGRANRHSGVTATEQWRQRRRGGSTGGSSLIERGGGVRWYGRTRSQLSDDEVVERWQRGAGSAMVCSCHAAGRMLRAMGAARAAARARSAATGRWRERGKCGDSRWATA